VQERTPDPAGQDQGERARTPHPSSCAVLTRQGQVCVTCTGSRGRDAGRGRRWQAYRLRQTAHVQQKDASGTAWATPLAEAPASPAPHPTAPWSHSTSYFYSTYHLERRPPDSSPPGPSFHNTARPPSQLPAPFGRAGFIDDQDGRLLTEVLKRVGTQVIAYPIHPPDGASEQALHSIGTRFLGVFSQLPPVFSGRVTQDALQVGQHPATWLWTGKARGKTRMQTNKLLPPTADIGGGRPGSVEGDMLVLLRCDTKAACEE